MTREGRLALLLGTAPQKPEKTTKKETVGRWFGPLDSEQLREALKPLSDCYVTVLPSARVPALGAYTHADETPTAGFMSWAQALSTTHTGDHHAQPVYSPAVLDRLGASRRLKKEACDSYGVRCDALVFDWDTPQHKAWSDDDFRALVAQYNTHEMLKGAVWYRTRGGLRAIRPLSRPLTLGAGEASNAWRAFYEGAFNKLPKLDGQAFDPACSDSTRLFRLPWVQRRKNKDNPLTEAQEGVVYVPALIEPYEISATEYAHMQASMLPPIRKGDGVKGLVKVYESIGWLGAQGGDVNGHPKYSARCPFADMHSGESGKGDDDSCALIANEDGEYVVHCLHGSCKESMSGGGWRAHIQRTFPAEWARHCDVTDSQIVFDPLDYNGFLDSAEAVLTRAHAGELFQRGGEIVNLEATHDGEVTWHTWGADYLTGVLNRSARWMTEYTDKEGRTALRRAVVPKTIVQQSIEALRMRLPHVDGRSVLPLIDPITMTPTRLTRGYCEQTRTYLYPHPDLDLEALARVAQRVPSVAEAKDALTRIMELYSDFPWQRREHRLLAVSATFTASLRRSIDGPAPLFLVNANSKGVGKTKLIGAVIASVYGHSPILSAVPERTEELSKMLDSILLADEDYLVLDNIRGGIGDAQFDAFITSDSKKARILGKSQMFTARNRVFLAGTGNNAQLRADTDRRTLVMRLVTDLERPEERKGFRYHDLVSEARTRATSTWCDVLTIMRAYHHHTDAQTRADLRERGRNFGSFEVWSEWVRDPLMWIGEQVFEGAETCDVVAMSAQEVAGSRDDDTGDIYTLLAEWQASCDQRQKTVGAVWSASELASALRDANSAKSDDALYELSEMFTSLRPRYLQKVLGAMRDKVSGGYQLIAKRNRTTRGYVLETLTTPTPSPDDGGPSPDEPPSRPDWEACDIASPVSVADGARAEFRELTRRCEWRAPRGMCAKEKTECEWAGADGGMSDGEAESLKRRLAESLVQIDEPKPQPVQLALEGEDTPVLKIIREEMATGATRAQIVERLTREGIAPPVGKRKWTDTTVSKIIKAHHIERGEKPKQEPDRVAQFADRLGGPWRGYYPDHHPHSHTHVTGETPKAIDPTDPSGLVKVDPNRLLLSVVGYATTPAQVLASRPRRDSEEEA